MADAPLGRIVWHELLTKDPDGAAAFYPPLAGWTVNQWRPEYKVWMKGERMIGGTMLLPEEAQKEGAPSHWLMYLSTPDVHATAAKVKEHGGRVLVGPNDDPEIGGWAVLSDPQGAMFALHTPREPDASPVRDPELGDFSWHELATADNEAGMAFYSAVFGWKRDDTHDMGAMGTYILFSVEGKQSGGIYVKPPEVPAPPHWTNYIKVRSADDAARAIASSGGTVMHGPSDVPGGDRIAIAMDPQGAQFAVHSSAG